MISWHGKKCRKPDVFLAGALPFCGNCDRTADLTLDAFQQAEPPTIPQSPPWRLNLGWPSCIDYSERCVLDPEENEDLGPTLVARIQAGASLERSGDTPMFIDEHDADQELKPTLEALKSSDEIRLLHLKGGNWDDPLHGTLGTARLDQQRLDYEAVSYVWAGENDDATRCRQLFVGESWDVLPITENCAAALRRLRSSSRDRVLWIDAICIDQNNLLERSHQVSLMRAIYSGARRCLVFLGEHTEDSRQAMYLIDKGVSGKLSPQQSIAIDTLFQRKYFFRTWIFQELVSSPRVLVHCGDSTADWNRFFSQDWSKYSDVIQVPAWIKNFELARYRQALDFPRYIFETAQSLASDDRDKVFAILGLFDGLDKQGLVADYNLSMEQVYTGIAAYLLICHGMNHLLTIQSTKHPRLPSWVPDWRSIQPSQWDFHHQSASEVYDKAPEILRMSSLALVTDDSKLLWRDMWPSEKEENMDHMFVTGFDLGEQRYITIKEQKYRSGELLPLIHKETGALCISLDFLLPLSGFTRANYFPTVAYMPFRGHLGICFKWLIVSTSEINCSEDYVGILPENRLFLHLKRASTQEVFRIVGHCNLHVAIGETSDLPAKYPLQLNEMQMTKYNTCAVLFRRQTQRDLLGHENMTIPDIVGVWALQNWAATLWDAFEWARASLSPESAPLDGEEIPSLKAAYDEYVEKPQDISILRKERLVQCIHFWETSDSWDILGFQKFFLGPNHYQLTKYWKTWERYKQSVLEAFGRHTISLLDNDTSAALSIIQSVESHASTLMTSQLELVKKCRADSRLQEVYNGEIRSEPLVTAIHDYTELEKELGRLEEQMHAHLMEVYDGIDKVTDRKEHFENSTILWGTRWDAGTYIKTDMIMEPFTKLDEVLRNRHDAIVRCLEGFHARDCREILKTKQRIGDPEILAARYAKLAMDLSLTAGSGRNPGRLDDIKIQCGELGAILDLKLRMQEGPRIAII